MGPPEGDPQEAHRPVLLSGRGAGGHRHRRGRPGSRAGERRRLCGAARGNGSRFPVDPPRGPDRPVVGTRRPRRVGPRGRGDPAAAGAGAPGDRRARPGLPPPPGAAPPLPFPGDPAFPRRHGDPAGRASAGPPGGGRRAGARRGGLRGLPGALPDRAAVSRIASRPAPGAGRAPGAELRAAAPDQGRDERRRNPPRPRFPCSRGAGEEPAHRARGEGLGRRDAASWRRDRAGHPAAPAAAFRSDAGCLAGRGGGLGRANRQGGLPPGRPAPALAHPAALFSRGPARRDTPRAGGPGRGLRRRRRSRGLGPGGGQPGAGALPGADHRSQEGDARQRTRSWRGPRSWCPRSGASRASSSASTTGWPRPSPSRPGSTRSRCRPRGTSPISR